MTDAISPFNNLYTDPSTPPLSSSFGFPTGSASPSAKANAPNLNEFGSGMEDEKGVVEPSSDPADSDEWEGRRRWWGWAGWEVEWTAG